MSLPNLSPDQFAQFVEAVHGYAPFLWQNRMAGEILGRGAWPQFISLPTSAGKTALIDIAIFALACEARRAPAERRAPLRTFFVIDRRVVADGAFERAQKIEHALTKAAADERGEPVLKAVAALLQHLAGKDAALLRCALLRGGIALDDSWIRSPVQPTVCVSTVDQIGSRLLFRGYGVSPRQRGIHASLVAHDSLVIVDEAHISKPFCTTAEAVRKLTSLAEPTVIRPLRIVQMTATPRPDQIGFALQPEEEAEAELARRIGAKKPASLETVAEAAEAHGQPALVAKAIALAEAWGAEKPRVIGIVVNRVLTARRIFDALKAEPGTKALFIGRIRSLDRDAVWKKWPPHLISDPKERVPIERTLFVAATQTIEVGADLDFDALISELAPLDALRQRFGRLNRRGRPIDVKACVIATREQTGARFVDSVYQRTLAPTWKWLQLQLEGRGQNKTVDFSHASINGRLSQTDDETRKAMVVTPPETPLLHRAIIDAWACTTPPLMHDPDVAPFLHGDDPPQPEVQIVWRADLDPFVFRPDAASQPRYKERVQAVRDLVETLPPSSREALPMPVFTAIRWLQQLASLDLTDTATSKDAQPDNGRPIRPVIVWHASDDIRLTTNRRAIRPGDVLIVPSSYGGADEFGWIGTAAKSEHVADRAEEAAWDARRAPFIRLHAAVLAQHGVTAPSILEAAQAEEANTGWREWIAGLERSAAETEDARWRERLARFAQVGDRDVEVIRRPFYPGAILRSRLPLDRQAAIWVDDEHDEGSQTTRVPLAQHLSGVAEFRAGVCTACRFAERTPNNRSSSRRASRHRQS